MALPTRENPTFIYNAIRDSGVKVIRSDREVITYFIDIPFMFKGYGSNAADSYKDLLRQGIDWIREKRIQKHNRMVENAKYILQSGK